VAFKQRLHHAHYFANGNRVDVEFVSASGERHLVERIQFSGESDIVEVEIPFEPVFWAIDPNFKMGDACYDYTQTLGSTGSTNLAGAYFRVQVNEISGESILRVEHNLFAPTPAKNDHPNIVRISEKHFWRVRFLQYNTMQAQYSFSYEPMYDKELLHGYTKDDLVLLHRKDAAHDWQMIPATVTGSNQAGRLTTNFILPGEYTFGICDNVKIKEWERDIAVYPNPVTDELRVTGYELQIGNIEIYDALGRMREIPHEAQRKEESHVINVAHLSSGTYYLKITFNNKTSITKKFIKL
jgi:hypothetical protein